MEKYGVIKPSTFQGLTSLGVNYFKTLFKTLMQTNITYNIKVGNFPPNFVDLEINDKLTIKLPLIGNKSHNFLLPKGQFP